MSPLSRSPGLGQPRADHPLKRRLTVLTLVRLVFLFVLLAILANWTTSELHLDSPAVVLALGTLGLAFVLAAVYATVLRTGKHLRQLSHVQLVMDQLIWTMFVYLSGGANSSVAALYGLTALTGAILDGLRGAVIAAITGFVLYALMSVSMVLGVLPIPNLRGHLPYVTSFDQLATPLSLNLLVMVVVTMLSGYLAERLRTAGGQLQQANERARRAEQLAQLGKVAAGLAHEIRNPLGAVSASIELLRDSPGLNDEDRHLCDIIQRETSRLDDLVSDMLNLSRDKPPRLTMVDLGTVAREVAMLASRTGRGASDVDVRVEISPADEKVIIEADQQQLTQMLWNLVRNAVFATAPKTEVLVKVAPPSPSTPFLEVIDHGPGIPEKDLEHLFDAFFTTRSHGSGIGLAVVRQIADKHGWTVRALSNTSEQNSGARFQVFDGPAPQPN